MKPYEITIRELELWDYTWMVEADGLEEAKQKALNGEGEIMHNQFVEGAGDNPREIKSALEVGEPNRLYTVSLTLSVEAMDKEEALKEFIARVETQDFDHDSLEVEEEED